MEKNTVRERPLAGAFFIVLFHGYRQVPRVGHNEMPPVFAHGSKGARCVKVGLFVLLTF